MKVYITGSRGLIGSHLKYALMEAGHEIIEWDLEIKKDIKDFEIDFVDHAGKDFCIHLAAHANVRQSFKDPEKYWQNNIENTKLVQGVCAMHNIPMFYASSSCVHNWWKSPYGVTKRVNEVTAWQDQIGLRFTTVYGPGARDTMFISKLVDGTCEYVTEHIRDFVHVDDVVDAIMLLMKQDITKLDRTYEIGTGKGKMVRYVAYAGGYSGLPIKPGEECEAQDNTADNSQLIKLGWTPQHNIIDYVKKHCKPDKIVV